MNHNETYSIVHYNSFLTGQHEVNSEVLPPHTDEEVNGDSTVVCVVTC